MILRFNGRELSGMGAKIPATCVVRNELNGWREADQVVRTAGSTHPHGLPYYPRQFPAGRWDITRVVDMGADTAYWPVFIDTAATQELTAWNVVNGRYDTPTPTVFMGHGYGIHHARYERNGAMVASRTTLGCIGILDPADALRLAGEIREAMGLRQAVVIDVLPWDEWGS